MTYLTKLLPFHFIACYVSRIYFTFQKSPKRRSLIAINLFNKISPDTNNHQNIHDFPSDIQVARKCHQIDPFAPNYIEPVEAKSDIFSIHTWLARERTSKNAPLRFTSAKALFNLYPYIRATCILTQFWNRNSYIQHYLTLMHP